jgi:hypothetical protein
MKKLMLLCASFCAAAFVFPAAPARAQTVYWVAHNGSDGNSCSETSPCATFAGAIMKGGAAQINCIDSGNYGALNTTTVSIVAGLVIDCGVGNIGEMTTNGGDAAININTSAAATIVLRHLSLNGGDGGASGVNTQSFPSGTLIVEDCIIHGFRGVDGSGIAFTPSSGRGTLQVSNSLLYDNNTGIFVSPATGQVASVTLNRVELTDNIFDGLDLLGGTVAGTIRQSLVAENGNNGITAQAGADYFTIEESSIVDNLNVGIETASAGSNVFVGASTIGGNATGVLGIGGSLASFGNNQISANGSDGTFTGTTPLQ